MGVVDRKKTSHISGDAIFGNMPIEGTSARTRPFSFEEVMLRRKNKEVVADAKEGAFEPREHYEKNIGGGFNRTDDVHKLVMDMKDKGKEGSRKTEEITSKKGEHHSKGRYKDKNDLDTDTEVKHRHHKSSGEKQSKNDTKNRHRSRTDDRAKAEFEKESRKKRSKDVMTKDKDMEKDRDYERKPKRIHHTVSDAKFRSELDRSNFKTVQSKLQEFEYSERGRRHEASKSKSRRSRSRERYHKREKSISLSPRLHKRSYHEESSSHFRGRLGRQYSDTDKYRTSWSGGYDNRHYQHRGSGLGGYSPRKRRINNTSKSPSPMTGSPEKKATTWDQPPAGSLPASILSASTNADNFPSHHIMQNVSKILPAPSANTTETVSNTSADSIQLTQATRPMRRLYIENLPPSASDKTMTEWLNGVLYSSGSQPQGTPCISCIINKEKSQAVVEFLTPEDATTALSYNGKSFSGSVLKIRRPKDFIDMTTGTHDKPYAVVEANRANRDSQTNNSNHASKVDCTISDVVKDSPHKLFIGGISKSLSPRMLMEIVSAFGPLKAYHYEVNEELNQPCAFLEYLDKPVTLNALTGLNGMKLGGQILSVVRVLSDDQFNEDNAECIATYTIPENARPLLENPTQILKLKNVFNIEDFTRLSESELEETLEDIRLECARFGTVKFINVVRYSCSSNTINGVSEQNPSIKKKDLETGEETSRTEARQCTGIMLEPQDLEDAYEETHSNDEIPMCNPVNKETCSPSQTDNHLNHEGSLESNVTEESLTKGDVDAEANVREDLGMENSLVLEKSEDTRIKSKVTDMEKPDMEMEDGNSQSCHVNVFEPTTVLVEFLREEATSMAVHCLNGRLYGEQVVSAGYAAYDAYRAQFPR